MTRKSRPLQPLRRRYDALLIDLDGTLIKLDLGRFIPAFFEALAKYFAHRFAPDTFAHHLFMSTQTAMKGGDPGQSNEAAFYSDFCHRLDVEDTAIRPLIDKFYEDEFPRLRAWAAPRSHAGSVLTAAKRRGLKLVLATQPVFPRCAVLERLSWGGLSAAPFDHITSMENSHFCKPLPEYYLEIARNIGIPPQRCLMAGNDTRDDVCAAKTGMGTFLVEGDIIDHDNDTAILDYRGTLEELASLIKGDFQQAIT